MAGFQYIALGDWEIKTSIEGDLSGDMLKLLVFSARLYGFIVSLFGTLICLITIEYLRTIQHETIETKVRGILRYAYFFQCCDYTAITAIFLLAISSNMILWNETVPILLAVATNILTAVFGLAFLYAFSVIIVGRQRSRLIYDDPNFVAAKKRQ